jgi:hypothetical protein
MFILWKLIVSINNILATHSTVIRDTLVCHGKPVENHGFRLITHGNDYYGCPFVGSEK